MKRISIIFGVVILVLLAILLVVPFLIPTAVYKAQIEAAATQSLGRTVSLQGNPKLAILPVLSARIDGVEIANPEGFSDETMIEAGRLSASIKILPLFSQRVEVAQIRLDDATVRLERLADGTTNWQLGDPERQQSGDFETGIDSAALTNASVFYRDWTTNTQFALTDFDATAQLRAFDQPLISDGSGMLNGQSFGYSVHLETIANIINSEPVALDFKLETILGAVKYDGTIILTELPSVDGEFELYSDALKDLIPLVSGFNTPIATEKFDAINASGKVRGALEALTLNFSNLSFEASGLKVDYAGEVIMGAVPTLDGELSLNASDAQQLLKPGHPLLPILALLGDVDFTANLQGSLLAPSLSNVRLSQTSEDLRTDFTGDFGFAGNQPLNGEISISSSNPRAVLGAFGFELPETDRFKSFSLSGTSTGSVLSPTLTGANITLDDTSLTGELSGDLQGERPRIAATLQTDRLDLVEVSGGSHSSRASGSAATEAWDNTDLDLSALNLLDAEVSLIAGEIALDQITMEDVKVVTRLANGRLLTEFRQTGEQPGFRAFQGNWSGNILLDASAALPTLQITASADSISTQEMLGSLAGFQNLTGIGNVEVDLNSRGNSIQALMSGLNGSVRSDLSDGVLKGVNLAQLVQKGSDLRSLLSGGGLTIASFADALSPNATTDFSEFLGSFEIQNGIARVSDLRINNPSLGVTGSGQIDIGMRTLDLSLTPRIDAEATGAGSTIGVGSIAVPLRVFGNWNAIQYGLDAEAVQAQLSARLRDRATSAITDQIGGEAGGIIGEILDSTTRSNPDEEELGRVVLENLFGIPQPAEDETNDD